MSVKAFKGFNKDLTCHGFQYAEGETFEHEGSVEACCSGFHAVTMPLDVLKYYPPNESVYHEVELDGQIDHDREDSKVAAQKIKIGARLDLTGLIKAQVDFVFSRAKSPTKKGATDKENGLATASGYSGAATASGRYGAATASGYYGAATASGYSGAATASGEKTVAIATGYKGRARGAAGTWIVLTERDDDMNILGIQSALVDGETIKADTFYVLRDGKIQEA